MTEIVSSPARARSKVKRARGGRIENLDLHFGGPDLLQRGPDLVQHLSVVGAVFV